MVAYIICRCNYIPGMSEQELDGTQMTTYPWLIEMESEIGDVSKCNVSLVSILTSVKQRQRLVIICKDY